MHSTLGPRIREAGEWDGFLRSGFLRALGQVRLVSPETRGLWQNQVTQNSSRKAFLRQILPPYLGSDPQASPAAPPPLLKHTSAGGRRDPKSLQGPPCGSSPLGDVFVSDCHITRSYIPPWGLGPGRAGRGRQYVSRKERAGRSLSSSSSAPPSENAGTVSR